MPIYSIENTISNEVSEVVLSYDQLQEHLQQNPHLRHIITGAPAVVRGSGKPDDSFRDKLKALKKAHRGSTINTF